VKLDIHEPCPSCPYRKDAQLAKWHREHFETLLERDQSMMGAVYGCHGTAKLDEWSVCAGWMLDQLDRGMPSIQLRLLLRDQDADPALLDKYNDGGHELYESLDEMCRVNLEVDDRLRRRGVIIDDA
jgi:hypothetical protein